MNYLKYIEFSAENLQFYLWLRDYTARFEKLPGSEQALSPEWNQAQAEAEANGTTSSSRPLRKVSPQIAEVLRNTDFADGKPKAICEKADPFHTPDKTPSLEEKRDGFLDDGSSAADSKTVATTTTTSHHVVADQAFEDAGMKWKPCKLS